MIILSLSGGLGNQLFQIAAAKMYADQSNIFLDTYSHSPELSASGKPIFMTFSFIGDSKFRILPRFPVIISRLLSLNLRLSLSQSKSQINSLKKIISHVIVVIYLSIRFLKCFRLITPSSVGELSKTGKDRGNFMLNGYFQSRNSLAEMVVYKFMQSAFLESQSERVYAWVKKARTVKPIVVHYRIGDYVAHPGMGVLDVKYFVDGIRYVRSQTQTQIVWLFSDEPEKAMKSLRNAGVKNVIEVPKFDACSTFELMRNGSGFVISNSTFSWWASALKYNADSVVCAPNPWFRSQTPPLSIYMKEWKLVPSWRSDAGCPKRATSNGDSQ